MSVPVALRSKALLSWVCEFEYSFGNGCSSPKFVLRCSGNGLCHELITRSEEPYRVCVCVCVCLMVCIWKPQQLGGLGLT